jgi:hypothetical protein
MLARAVAIYSEANKSFPALGDDNMLTAVAGSTASDQARASYSWRVRILPYLEEGDLYDAVQRNSKGFVLPPTSPSVAGPDGRHFLQRGDYLLRCPSFAGRAPSDVSVEGALISNYHAISATRFQYMSTPIQADGVIIPGGGVRERDVTDGLSSTVLLCESKEPRFAVWGEAVTAWVVALDPEQTASNTQLDWAEMRTSLRLGAQKYDTPFLPTRLWAAGGDRWWGPSSDHRGGVVMHAFGDVHVRPITSEVDAKVYASIVTRADGDNPKPFVPP